MERWLVFVLGLALSASARSGPKLDGPFCAASAALAASARFCVDNPLFTRSATACLDKLDALAGTAGRALEQRFRGEAGGKDTQQARKFGVAAGDYSQSLAELDAVIAADRSALRQMKEYLAALNLPVDARNAMGKPCYGDNYRSIEAARKRFAERLTQLEAARAEASRHGGSSGARQAGVGSSEGAAAFKAGHERGHGAPGKGSTGSPSDITGLPADQGKPAP